MIFSEPYQLFQERHVDDSDYGYLLETQANGDTHEWPCEQSIVGRDAMRGNLLRNLKCVNKTSHPICKRQPVSLKPARMVCSAFLLAFVYVLACS